MTERGHLDIGMTYIERGRPDLAIDELRRALADDPDNAECLAWLAAALTATDQNEESEAFAREAIGRAPDWAFPHEVLAHALIGRGKPKAAEAAAREALRLDAEDAGNYAVLASALGGQRRWREALDAAEQGLEMDPNDDDCANVRATALIQLGQAEDADFALQEALRHDPEDAVTHHNVGWAALHANDHEKAIRHYREALRLDPSSEAARAGLVEALKARSPIYRIFLRFFLFLTRIPAQVVFALLIGSIFLRSALRSLSEAYPALAPFLMPVFYATIAFILLTWIAEPLFNLLLRFDREGRHALLPIQIRQANWLLAMLLLTLGTLGVWLAGVSLAGVATILCALLILPVVTAAGAEGASLKVASVFALGLTALAIGIVFAAAHHESVRRNEYEPFRQRLDITSLSDADLDEIEKRVADWEPEERDQLVQSAQRVIDSRSMFDNLLTGFLWGFVAFSWICGGGFSTGTR